MKGKIFGKNNKNHGGCCFFCSFGQLLMFKEPKKNSMNKWLQWHFRFPFCPYGATCFSDTMKRRGVMKLWVLWLARLGKFHQVSMGAGKNMWVTLPETNSLPMKIPIFPGKYPQNGGFSWAMLVSGRVLHGIAYHMTTFPEMLHSIHSHRWRENWRIIEDAGISYVEKWDISYCYLSFSVPWISPPQILAPSAWLVQGNEGHN